MIVVGTVHLISCPCSSLVGSVLTCTAVWLAYTAVWLTYTAVCNFAMVHLHAI